VGLQLGGALSKLVDRLPPGAVADVLTVGGLAWNIADAALLLGALLAASLLWWTRAPQREAGRPAPRLRRMTVPPYLRKGKGALRLLRG
jgi:hypothetical protein